MDGSHAGQLKEWDDLIAACRASRKVKSQLSADLDTFDEVIREARSALERRSELALAKQEATRHLNEILGKGREQAMHIRLGVRVHLGLRNERLEQFGIAPLRKRRKRKPPVL